MMLITCDSSFKRSRFKEPLCRFGFNQTPTYAALRSNTHLFCNQQINISTVYEASVGSGKRKEKTKSKFNYIIFQEVQKQPKMPEASLVATTDS